MTTLRERTIPRLREVLNFLVESGGTSTKEDVLKHLESVQPPEPQDLETVSNGSPKWANAVLWQTTGLVKGEWLEKDGYGTWTITKRGREALENFPDPVAFYNEADRLYDVWNQARKADRRRAWFVRGRQGEAVGEWLLSGSVGIAAPQLREIQPDIELATLQEVIRSDLSYLRGQELKAHIDELMAFLTRMRPGDIVLTTSEQKVFIGDLVSQWRWERSDDGGSRVRRGVEWRNADSPIPFVTVPPPLPAKLASNATIADLTADVDLIDTLVAPGSEGGEEEGLRTRTGKTELAEPSSSLADDLLIEAHWLHHLRDLLNERHQVILYGPPGTGKTYLARRFAGDLVGHERVKLVQFHPSYAYEDFFEGYRPTASGSSAIEFELRPGPLRQLVSRALERRDECFIMIIDEINRAKSRQGIR